MSKKLSSVMPRADRPNQSNVAYTRGLRSNEPPPLIAKAPRAGARGTAGTTAAGWATGGSADVTVSAGRLANEHDYDCDATVGAGEDDELDAWAAASWTSQEQLGSTGRGGAAAVGRGGGGDGGDDTPAHIAGQLKRVKRELAAFTAAAAAAADTTGDGRAAPLEYQRGTRLQRAQAQLEARLVLAKKAALAKRQDAERRAARDRQRTQVASLGAERAARARRLSTENEARARRQRLAQSAQRKDLRAAQAARQAAHAQGGGGASTVQFEGGLDTTGAAVARAKPSPALLQLRHSQAALARGGRFDDAAELEPQIAALASLEAARAAEAAEAARAKEQRRLREAHAREASALGDLSRTRQFEARRADARGEEQRQRREAAQARRLEHAHAVQSMGGGVAGARGLAAEPLPHGSSRMQLQLLARAEATGRTRDVAARALGASHDFGRPAPNGTMDMAGPGDAPGGPRVRTPPEERARRRRDCAAQLEREGVQGVADTMRETRRAEQRAIGGNGGSSAQLLLPRPMSSSSSGVGDLQGGAGFSIGLAPDDARPPPLEAEPHRPTESEQEAAFLAATARAAAAGGKKTRQTKQANQPKPKQLRGRRDREQDRTRSRGGMLSAV